ncbi:MAG: alpha-hydroxy acid oxidase [Alphaproteobacteria bacterium]
MKLQTVTNAMEFRRHARRALPRPFWHYLEGSSDDGWTKSRNTDAFERFALVPETLRDVSDVTMRTKLLGAELSMPVFLAPTGMTRLFHHGKELAVARAAARAGTMYSLSTVGTTSIEDIGAATDGPKLFQIYAFRDRGLIKAFIDRCREAKYDALCLTVDTVVGGNREMDIKTGMSIPPKLTLASLADFLLRWNWTVNYLKNSEMGLANIPRRPGMARESAGAVAGYINEQFSRSLTWDDAAWIAQTWGGPFALKGVMSVSDAKRAKDVGISALMISNHGGRQLDGVPAPIDQVAEIRDAVGDEMELIVDGGVRRGTHVLKALARGATACSIGRPYLYALAAAGEAGVGHLLGLLRAELERDLTLLGCADVAQVNGGHIRSLT